MRNCCKMSCSSCSMNPRKENNHNCSASLLSPSVCVHVRNCSRKKMASTVFAYEASTTFVFVCRNVCEPRTRVVFNVCVCQGVCVIAALDCVSVWLCVGDIKVLISTATQQQCHCEGTKQHRAHQSLPNKRGRKVEKKEKIFFFFIAHEFQIEIK